MARKFEFQNNNLELEIAGNLFEIDIADKEMVKALINYHAESMAIADKLSKEAKKEDADYSKALHECIELVIKGIDSTLGEGSSKKIFKNREVRLFDALDVMNFILNEYNQARDKNFNKYSSNRAQRRAKK